MTDEAYSSGRILSIQLCPGHRKPMNKVGSAEAIENLGLKGDRHALPDSSRQILMIEQETLNELGLSPGAVKENITTTGVVLMKLPYKERLLLGGDVILEITKPCSPCSRMEEIRPGLGQELAGRRGILARVIRGGVISVGDPIRPAKD
jgi:MOSC domain-containing protein YiiM